MALITPKDAVGKKVLLKQYEPTENEFNTFVEAVNNLKSEIDGESRESFNEGRIRDFLKKAFYLSTNYIDKPDKGDIDLVILEDSKPKSDVKVIIEAKRVANKAEFPTANGEINVKALQETVLYYLRESISKKNKRISRIVITNGIEWFIFSAEDFETLFVTENKSLRKTFEDYEGGRLSFSSDTIKFYSDIAKPAIEKVKDRLNYVWFDINKLTSKSSLITVLKILSPFYLLNKPCATDSNVLNDKFYKELLHIIGLYENDKDESGKKKAKKTIERLPADKRESGSLLENAITQLSYKNPFNLFDRAIQLVIIWINRILFLKLLEAQLVKWHGGDKKYKFLTTENLPEYDELKELFFGVVARRPAERAPELEKYKDIPYLNSSLFEQTEEMNISELKDKVEITVFKNTVLKGEGGNKMNPLEYLLRFLDAYDFGAAESEDGLRKESKTLINASVLGLIFEKINGYKDGSFYTPGTITQYMCKETIRRAVVQKFNDIKGWNCQSLKEVGNECAANRIGIEERNRIINSLRICDPAVGSGHFLVSALNELIYIKYKLNALCSANGDLLDGVLKIENDELIITRIDDNMFSYNPNDKLSQKIQETLFNEKRTIIENCLFGVDINPNSVNICRLRLWIELLKNAYYHTDGTLETLPNIDINIKCGNSLVSRYDTKVDISNVLKKKELDDYKEKVRTYKDAPNKIVKHELEEIIEQLKEKFKESLKQNSGAFRKYKNAQKIISDLTSPQLFEPTKKEKKEIEERIKNAKKEIADYEEKQKNSIYENALEWRLEFPETLDEEGNFVGFDVVIGNPPYIDSELMVNSGMEREREYLQERFQNLSGNWDMYMAFFELALSMGNIVAYITPDKWLAKDFGEVFRKNQMCRRLQLITRAGDVFDNAKIDAIITLFVPESKVLHSFKFVGGNAVVSTASEELSRIKEPYLIDYLFSEASGLVHKMDSINTHIKDYSECENACATSDFYVVKELIEENPCPDLSKFYKLINTGTIEKYKNKWADKEITYGGKYRFPVVSKERFDETLGKSYRKRAVSKKIIFKGLNLLDGCLDEFAEIIPGKATLVICHNDINLLKFLLGLLNSKLPIFYFKTKYASSSYCGGISFTKDMINDFPISADSIQQQPIIDAVNKILEEKELGPKANIEKINECEREIDMRVYKLYGLTLDEAQIIDASVTAEEFEKY